MLIFNGGRTVNAAMSFKKLKRPSSARRNIQLETFSSFVSQSRLQRVQSLLRRDKTDRDGCDAILCIAGIDSRYNDGTNELINYLLFGFFESRKQELESSGFDEEVIDEAKHTFQFVNLLKIKSIGIGYQCGNLIILIRHHEVDVYCNPINYHYLLPYVSHWRNIRFHCLTDSEYEDEEIAEEFKINSFIAMVQGLGEVGIPYSHSGHIHKFDKMAVEKWPIIQAYALDEFGQRGFFTMQHQVVDIGPKLSVIYSQMDPTSLETLLTEQLTLFRRQWTTMISTVDVDMSSKSDTLTEDKVSESLKSYFKHGRVGVLEEDSRTKQQQPFVLFGTNSRKTTLDQARSGDKYNVGDLKSCSIGNQPAKLMVCHGVSPKGPITCTRTYFFTHLSPEDPETKIPHEEEDDDTRMLVQVYATLVDSIMKAINVYVSTLSVHKARAAAVEYLCDECSKLSNPALTRYLQRRSNIVFTLEAVDHTGSFHSIEEGVPNLMLKSVSMILHDIPSSQVSGKVLGSLAFSEVFQDSIIRIQREDGKQKINSDVVLVTASIPRYLSWSVKSVPELPSSEMQIRLTKLDKYGKLLLEGETVHIATDRPICSPAIEAHLYAYEECLVLYRPQSGPLILDNKVIEALHFYDGNSPRVVSVIMIHIHPAARSSIPYFLQSSDGVLYITFVPKSRAYKLMYQKVLPQWKENEKLPAVQNTDELPKTFVSFHKQQQNQYLCDSGVPSSFTKAAASFPDLNKFLLHLAASSVSQLPVDESLFPVLLLKKVEEVTPSEEANGVVEVNTKRPSQIIVTVICGVEGSHKQKLADTLVNLTKNQIQWTVLKETPNSTKSFIPREAQRALMSLYNNIRRRKTTEREGEKHRVLLITPGFVDIVDVVCAICNHPDPDVQRFTTIGAVTVCIDPLNFFIGHRLTLPVLLNHCAQGWVNNIVFTSSTSVQNPVLADAQNLLRSINNNVSFFLAEKGDIIRSMDVDAVLSETLFNEASHVRARYLSCPGWSQGLYSKQVLSFPVSNVMLTFRQPLQRALLTNKLRGLKGTWKSFPLTGNLFNICGNVKFSDSDQIMELQYSVANDSLSLRSVESHSGVPNGDGINPDDSKSYLVFTGCSLQENDLKDWLRTCAKQKPQKKKLVSRKDLTREDIKKIHADHHLDALPAGWFYNGTHFVSFDGEKQNEHPSLEDFIKNYLEEKNKEIAEFNSNVDQTASSFVDLFA